MEEREGECVDSMPHGLCVTAWASTSIPATWDTVNPKSTGKCSFHRLLVSSLKTAMPFFLQRLMLNPLPPVVPSYIKTKETDTQRDTDTDTNTDTDTDRQPDRQ